MTKETIFVNIGDYKVAQGDFVLEVNGLGSCVGVLLYDKVKKIAGLAHIMLPSSSIAKGDVNFKKFADTGIKMMLEDMKKLNSSIFVSAIAGGACMFETQIKDEILKIGEKNVEAVRKILNELKIPIIVEEVGGKFGRTLRFEVITGKLFIKTTQHGIKEFSL